MEKTKFHYLLKNSYRNIIKVPFEFLKILKIKDPQDFFLKNACMVAENNEYDFAFKAIPKKSDLFHHNNYSRWVDDFAIVLQGPIRIQDNFTLETVKYYRQVYPKAGVIVSTWNDAPTEVLKKINKCGANVILCEKPKKSGQLNLNFQLYSSFKGIEASKKMGFHFVAKTRCDQRITKDNIFPFFENLLKIFPPQNTSIQKNRIITLSMNYGNFFYPYLMSDFFYFGNVEDMCTLFDGELDNRIPFSMPKNSTRYEYSRLEYAPEVYILKKYLKKLGCSGDSSVKDYWCGLKNYLICVDMKMLDLYWPKYENKYFLHQLFGDYYEHDTGKQLKTANFDFVNWFNLYTGALEYKKEYEKYSNIPFE